MKIIDNSYIKYLMFNIMMYMRKNQFTRKLYLLIDKFGIRITISKFLNYICNERYFKNPTRDMLKSKQYFQNNVNKLDVINLLSDEKSKNTFLRMIDFRASFNSRILPYNSYKKQYWFTDYFSYKNGEVMIDCGAFDGDSIMSFKKAMNNHNISFYKIIAFEPDKNVFELLKHNYPNEILFLSGVGRETKQNLFEYRDYGGSCLYEGNNKGKNNNIGNIIINKLDEIPECQDATIIKMDIEGAEYDALLGAEKLIKRNKPKLAICIYHKDEDFIRIPLLIHEWVPEYKLYIMQHSNTIYETVLYATL